MSAMSLAGMRVLVTGGAGAVGLATARQMRTGGAQVMLTDRNAEVLAGAQAEGFACHAADLARTGDVAGLFAEADRVLGGLDILVGCAGIGSDPLMAFADDSWRDVIESNLVGHVACTRAAVERIRRAPRGTGSVILVGSISVHIKAVGESVYNAAKGGLASFAETLRKELIPNEIRVTLIEPGAIASALQPVDEAERARRVAAQQFLRAEDVADAVVFAATRPPGVDCVTLRIEPMDQKIY